MRCALLLTAIVACAYGGGTPSSPLSGCVEVAVSKTNCLQPVDVQRCLAGKRIVILGNSVSRHWAYTLAHVMQGMAKPLPMNRNGGFESGEILDALSQMPDRQAEKTNCASGDVHGHKQCEWVLGNGTAATTLTFNWVDKLAPKQLEDTVRATIHLFLGSYFPEHEAPVECLETDSRRRRCAFASSKQVLKHGADIVVVNLGGNDVALAGQACSRVPIPTRLSSGDIRRQSTSPWYRFPRGLNVTALL